MAKLSRLRLVLVNTLYDNLAVMIEADLKEALISMQDAISNSDAPAISKCLIQLDEALVTHKRELDPQLKHFLKRRSYQKALMFLEGEGDIPRGLCGGKGD